MKKIIYIVVATAFVLLFVFYVILMHKSSLDQLYQLKNENAELYHKMSILKDDIAERWMIERSELNINDVFDENNNKLDIESFSSTLPVLIFRFSKINCSECVVKQIDLVKKLVQNHQIQYLMISDYSNQRDLGFFKRVNKINNIIYDSKKLIDKENKTPFFCIYFNGYISDVFFPEDEFPELTEAYFKEMNDKYFCLKHVD